MMPLDTETKMCSAVFVSPLLAAENVPAACIGWGKYAQIRERDPNRFSATLIAHLCFEYLNDASPLCQVR